MTVLVAYDGSAPARKAVEYAFDEYDDDIVLLRVVEVADSFTSMSLQAVQEVLGRRRADASEELREEVTDRIDADAEYEIDVVSGEPAREIVAYAEDHDVDRIVVGSHGREGVSRVLLGSVAEGVVRRAPVTVIVVR
ncbi:universal stress protein [Saliphagus infecundisoli]|uniref:Universal stress protein n=1 Tax=Saliphagus infecundisoli TaxID=1849069 RepID=A0ABD5Q9C8_9EURY|nr:universal stress protein [Saliphagus infecundisoli]